MKAFPLLCAIGAFVWSSLASAQEGQSDRLQLTPETDLFLEAVPLVVPSDYSALVPPGLSVNLPVGFTATVFAAFGMQRPRLMAFSPEGVLHVADMRGRRTKDSRKSRIIAFPDRNGDGIAGLSELVLAADGLSYANSLAFYQGDLYVAETHQVVRLRDLDGDLVYEERTVFIDDIPDIPGNGFHGTRTILFDELAEKIYLGVGSPCDLCRQDEPVAGLSGEPLPQRPEWGTILQFDIDGSNRRVFASGIRNAIGLAQHPSTGALWATHNHYDLGGPDRPPEWVDIIRNGGFYGYPFVYGLGTWVDFSPVRYQRLLPITRADSLLAQRQGPPAVLLPAHLAPMAIHFYQGELFPPHYREVPLVALRGGKAPGNLASVSGFKVVALFQRDGEAGMQVADFLTGLQNDDGVWAKPVGLATDRQGHLYVSSDHGVKAIIKIGHNPLRVSWEHALPDAVLSGSTLDVKATIRLEGLAEGPVQVTADLSGLGGPAAVPLDGADGFYRLQASLVAAIPNGQRFIRVLVEQGPHRDQLVHRLVVVPARDQVVLDEGLEQRWTLDHSALVEPDLTSSDRVYSGATAAAFQARSSRLGGWNLALRPSEPLDPAGYRVLQLAFHPGDATLAEGGQLFLVVEGEKTSVLAGPGRHGLFEGYSRRVDLVGQGKGLLNVEQRQWQQVEIPLQRLDLTGPIAELRLVGTLAGTFFLDDIRLVAAPLPRPTAVRQRHQHNRPARLVLEPNRPNPFNSETAIGFSLPRAGPVELALYNASGQQVARLVQGWRQAGQYELRWDGTDDAGRALASGVYLYRLRVGDQVETQKLLLMK